MGYIKDDAIIVTGSRYEVVEARRQASELGLPTTELAHHTTNGACSFLIAPDGSKEGWEGSDRGDSLRRQWKEWASKQSIRWVHVSYDDERVCRIEDHWANDDA